MMERKQFILFAGISIFVIVSISCTHYKQPAYTHTSLFRQSPAIATTAIEVSGDTEKGEILKINFNRDTGECEKITIGEKAYNCKDKNITTSLQSAFFCIPVSTKDIEHQANTKMYNLVDGGAEDVYCGRLRFLSPGTDIQFLQDFASKNRKCKEIGGDLICYPPLN